MLPKLSKCSIGILSTVSKITQLCQFLATQPE